MRISICLALPFLIAGALPAAAASDAFTLDVTGHVPLVCQASLQNTVVTPVNGTAAAGAMHEFCNNASGYQVWVDTAPGLGGTAYVGSAHLPLSADGRTMIDQSSTAALRDVTLAFHFAGATPNVLSLRIVPL